jgi:hypothetical protein
MIGDSCAFCAVHNDGEKVGRDTSRCELEPACALRAMISADHLHRTPVRPARRVRRRPANGRRSAGIYVSRCGCQPSLDLPHVAARTRGTGTGCLRGGHAATSSCGGGRASSDGRWCFLRCLRRGLLAGDFFDRFCIPVQMVRNRPLTMATATAVAPVMRAAATMGSSNLMGTSTTPGQATTSRVPASHASCLILSLIGAFSEKPSGLFHRQTRCPGSRHRKSTSRARPACLVHARRQGSGNRLAAGIGSDAEHAAWSPPLPSHPTPDNPPARENGSRKAAAAEGIGLVRSATGPRVTM